MRGKTGKDSRQSRQNRRGAALILVITLLSILLALGLTFLLITRVETQNSTNTLNNTRSDLLADGMIAQGIQTLNEDFKRNPNATSTDHAWRSYYSGAWLAGKLWGMQVPAAGPLAGSQPPLWEAGLPHVDVARYFEQFPLLLTYLGSPMKEIMVQFPDGHMEALYQGPRTRAWLFYPRAEYVTDGKVNPRPLDFASFPQVGPRPIIYDPNVSLWIDVGGVLTKLDTRPPAGSFPGGAEAHLFFFLDMDKKTPEDLLGDRKRNVLTPKQLPFVLPNIYGYPMGLGKNLFSPGFNLANFPLTGDSDGAMYAKEIVDRFADVDNDGDGLKDSIWVPIGEDIPLSNDGIDSDLDGMTDETQDNGFNDDGFSEVNPVTDGIDQDGDGIVDEFDLDETREIGAFVYHGLGEFVDLGNGTFQRLGDGLDNDGDGLIDEIDPTNTDPSRENQLFLTSPLPGIRIPVDLNGDGVAGDLVPFRDAGGEIAGFRPLMVRMPDSIRVTYIVIPEDVENGIPATTSTQNLTSANVDRIDNNYDGLVNNYEAYAYIGPNPGTFFPFTLEKVRIGSQNQALIELNSNTKNQTAPITNLFYSSIWRHPYNWFPEDISLYETQRNRAYHDINVDFLDFVPASGSIDPPVFDPPIDDWLNFSTQYSVNDGPVVGSAGLSPPRDIAKERSFLIGALRITHSGEPVSRFVGRAAVLITDEASKVNLNVAGYHTYDDLGAAATGDPNLSIFRQVESGASTAQYDIRFLPNVGVGKTFDLYTALTGAPDALGADPFYFWDALFPGYGRVDDNGDALLKAFDGIDNDGDGFTDEGIRVPKLGTVTDAATGIVIDLDQEARNVANGGSIDPRVAQHARSINHVAGYIVRLGSLEGVDDPDELQRFNPLRNLVAEGKNFGMGTLDTDDNDNDGITNEIGELGDRMLHKKEQITQISGIGAGTLDDLKNLVTVNSSDLNAHFAHTADGIRAIPGLNMDLATPQQIARNIMLTGEFTPITSQNGFFSTPTDNAVEARAYAQGLRQADVSLSAPDPNPAVSGFGIFDGGILHYYDTRPPAQGGPPQNPFAVPPTVRQANMLNFVRAITADPVHALPADPQLQTLQLAVNIKDSTDSDHARTLLRTENRNLSVPDLPNNKEWDFSNPPNLAELGQVGLDAIPFPLKGDLNERELIPADEIFSTQSFENYARDALGFDIDTGQLQNIDSWWKFFARNNNIAGGDFFGNPLPVDPLGDQPGGVVGLDDGTNLIPEERRISYTVAGVESIVINELMVRPVRRVEAEATNSANPVPASDPMNVTLLPPQPPLLTPLNIENFDPSPNIFNGVLPNFIIGRTSLNNFTLPDTTIFDSFWELSNSATYPNVFDTLGDRSYLYSSANAANAAKAFDNPVTTTPVPVSDIIEFVLTPGIGPLEGLPAGRYYLTVNTQDALGNPTIFAANQLEYSIKYIDLNAAAGSPPNRTITEDYKNIISNYNYLSGIEPDFNAAFFDLYWESLVPEWISGRPGEAPGWIFLDGTPRFGDSNKATLINPNTNPIFTGYNAEFLNYFLDGGGVLPSPPNDPALFDITTPPANPNTTHTVTVPPIGSNIAICVAFRVSTTHPLYSVTFDHDGDAGVSTPEIPVVAPCINFLDFSQEPNHEYIELTNISDKQVNVGDWHLEVGIPGTESVTDPYRSLWRIPANTRIAPKGNLLLTINKFDEYLNGAPDSSIFANGIGMATLPVSASPTGVEGVTVPPISDFLASVVVGDDGDPTTLDTVNNPELLPLLDPLNTFAPALYPAFQPNAGSVFDPGLSPIPYIDNDGDGVSSAWSLVQAAIIKDSDFDGIPGGPAVPGVTDIPEVPDTDNVDLFVDIAQTTLAVSGDRWGRIVPLINVEMGRLDPFNPVSDTVNLGEYSEIDGRLVIPNSLFIGVDGIARLVLQGGFLPNYPEHDGIDNDGDGAYLVRDRQTGVYSFVPGTLDKDMVDNNLDGFIDETDHRVNLATDWWNFDGVDNDGDGSVDLSDLDGEGPGLGLPLINWAIDGLDNDGDLLFDEEDERLYGLSSVTATPYIAPYFKHSEGIDEGAIAGVFAPGSYESGSLPVRFYASRELYATAPTVSFRADGALGIDAFNDPVPIVEKNIDVSPFLGSPLSPPDWKAFVQRRWNPGDNVVVSLYDGYPDLDDPLRRGKVVDRVTYREYDVINRTIDDVAQSPYLIDGFHSGVADAMPNLDDVVSLDFDYPSFWRPNHMGLDFYRSLERKAPTYRGDRFGTSNRWEATDGNYDDWADSISFFERMLDMNTVPHLAFARDFDGQSVIPRFQDAFFNQGAVDMRLLSHAIWGTPLRMNTAHRMSENPRDLLQTLDIDVLGTPQANGLIQPSFLYSGASTPYWISVYNEGNLFLQNNRRPQFSTSLSEDIKMADKVVNFGGAYIDFSILRREPLNFIGGFYMAMMHPVPDDGGNLVYDEFVRNRDWTYGKAKVKNAAFESAMELMAVPFSQYTHVMQNVVRATESAPGLSDGESFLFSMQDVNRLNYFRSTSGSVTVSGIQVEPELYTQHDIAQRGQALGANDAASQIADALLDLAANSFANDTFTLTVGQADFVPVLGVGSSDQNLLNWNDSKPGTAPHAWAPVYLFELPADAGARGYPIGLDGVGGASVNPVYIFDLLNYFGITNPSSMVPDTMFASVSVDPTIPDYYNRWPLEKRAVMYVSQDDPTQGLAAEALFIWDAEDGLENGEYDVYVNTFEPGMFTGIDGAATDAAAAFGEALVTDTTVGSPPPPLGFVQDLLPKDPAFGITGANNTFNTRLELDVITNPAGATANALLPLCTNCLPVYEADAHGRILYGDASAQGVQPIVVKVTDNFLALRVRNHRTQEPGVSSNISAISHITLAPRKKTPGRINLNSVETTLVEVGATMEFFNPILGLPGVIDAYNSVKLPKKFVDPAATFPNEALGEPIGAGDDVALPQLPPLLQPNGRKEWPSPEKILTNDGLGPRFDWNTRYNQYIINNKVPSSLLPPTENIQGGTIPPTDMLMPPPVSFTLNAMNPGIGYNTSFTTRPEDEMTALRLMSLILEGRTEHADGRYYKSKADLIKDSSRFVVERDFDGDNNPPSSILLGEVSSLYPLSNENDPELRFEEVQKRFNKMGNLVTTRSDTFEIITTVQSGYLDDQDGDGVGNYRTPEFVVQAETKARVVYERRTPEGLESGTP